MLELLNQSLALVNLPLTVLLGLISVYWLLMVVGLIGSDSLNIDASATELGADIDATGVGDLLSAKSAVEAGDLLHAKAGIDAGDLLQAKSALGADEVVQAKSAYGVVEGGALSSILRFVNFHRVPIMVVISFFVFSMWVLGVLANHFFNPTASLFLGLAFLVPNYFVAILMTKAFTTPFVPLFKQQATSLAKKSDDLLGSTAVLRASLEGVKLGQAELNFEGSEYRLNVRSKDGARIEKGSQVVLVNRDETTGVYTVRTQ
jgi:hypothetical protein